MSSLPENKCLDMLGVLLGKVSEVRHVGTAREANRLKIKQTVKISENTALVKIQPHWKYSLTEKTTLKKILWIQNLIENIPITFVKNNLTEITTWMKVQCRWKYNLCENAIQ